MRRVLGLFGLLAVIAAVELACGTDDAPDPAPLNAKPVATSHGDDDDQAPRSTTASDASTITTPVAPVTDSGAATTFVGTLDATPAVPFGGAPYCKYTVTMKSIDIEVSIVPGGQVIGATVKNTMVEATVPPCTYAPSPPNNQSFAFTTLTQLPNGFELAFEGAPGNQPKTKLTVDLSPNGSSYAATAHWHRTDQVDILDWTVSSTFTLGPK